MTEEFEENNEDEDAATVELVVAAIVELVAAIVSVTDGSDTMKIFDTHREYRELQRKLNEEEKHKEDRRTEREREREREREKERD